jgi:hypothetical protein
MGTGRIVPRAPTGTCRVVATTADARRRLVAACPAEQGAMTLLKRLRRLHGKPEPVVPSTTPPSVNPVTAGGSGLRWLEFGQRAIPTDILAVIPTVTKNDRWSESSSGAPPPRCFHGAIRRAIRGTRNAGRVIICGARYQVWRPQDGERQGGSLSCAAPPAAISPCGHRCRGNAWLAAAWPATVAAKRTVLAGLAVVVPGAESET